jgi:phage gpG-like protein
VDRGNLRDSIDYQVSGGDTVEIGTNYGRLPSGGSVAAVHQFGATIRPRRGRHLIFTPRGFTHPIFARQVTIPARPFLPMSGLPQDWEEDIVDILTRHFRIP